MSDPNGIAVHVLDCAFQIHTRLGPGLMESVYETILARELVRLGHCVERQKKVSFEYGGMHFNNACRVDLLVDNAVVVEIKAAANLHPQYYRQVYTYLRLLDCRLGLLLNFGAPYLRDGIKRVVNDL